MTAIGNLSISSFLMIILNIFEINSQPSENFDTHKNPEFRYLYRKDARPHDYPWAARVVSQPRNSVGYRHLEGRCAGALIHPRYVLTEGYFCLPRGNGDHEYYVKLGSHFINETHRGEQVIRVEDYIFHEDYEVLTLNMMLLRLETEAVLNYFIQVISLARPAVHYGGRLATVVGWGSLNVLRNMTEDEIYPKSLQEVRVKVMAYDMCVNATSSFDGPYTPTDGQICTTSKNISLTKGNCNDDWGIPLAYKNKRNGEWTLIGIAKYAVHCEHGMSGLYTDVGYYHNWIMSKIS